MASALLAVLIVTILLVYLRVQKQEESLLRLQSENHRNQLRAEIYDKVADSLSDWGDKVGEAQSAVRSVVSSLRLSLEGPPFSGDKSIEDLSNANREAATATSRVLLMLERYEIVFLRFAGARQAMSEGHLELLETFRDLHGELCLVLPLRHPSEPGSRVAPLVDLDQERMDEIEDLATRYFHACGNLLGGLFERTVPPRQPGDPEVKVLRRSTEEIVERQEGRW